MKNPSKKPARLAFQISSALLLSLGLGLACVTVNVNFPESAVQKATDDYVKDLYRAKEKGKSETTETPVESKKSTFHFSLVNEAYAADSMPRFVTNSSKAQAIGQQLASRVSEVKKYKAQGNLGETADGKLVVKTAPASAIEAKKLEQLVKAENNDREELYAEVTSASGMSSGQVKQVSRSFANSFKKESPAGTWIEENGAWSQQK